MLAKERLCLRILIVRVQVPDEATQLGRLRNHGLQLLLEVVLGLSGTTLQRRKTKTAQSTEHNYQSLRLVKLARLLRLAEILGLRLGLAPLLNLLEPIEVVHPWQGRCGILISLRAELGKEIAETMALLLFRCSSSQLCSSVLVALSRVLIQNSSSPS